MYGNCSHHSFHGSRSDHFARRDRHTAFVPTACASSAVAHHHRPVDAEGSIISGRNTRAPSEFPVIIVAHAFHFSLDPVKEQPLIVAGDAVQNAVRCCLISVSRRRFPDFVLQRCQPAGLIFLLPFVFISQPFLKRRLKHGAESGFFLRRDRGRLSFYPRRGVFLSGGLS